MGAPLQRKLNSLASWVGLADLPLSRSWLCSLSENEIESWVIDALLATNLRQLIIKKITVVVLVDSRSYLLFCYMKKCLKLRLFRLFKS